MFVSLSCCKRTRLPQVHYTLPGLPSLLTGEHALPCHERDSLQGCLAGPELSCKHQVPQVPQVPQSSPTSLHKSQSLTTNPLNRKAPIKRFKCFKFHISSLGRTSNNERLQRTCTKDKSTFSQTLSRAIHITFIAHEGLPPKNSC